MYLWERRFNVSRLFTSQEFIQRHVAAAIARFAPPMLHQCTRMVRPDQKRVVTKLGL